MTGRLGKLQSNPETEDLIYLTLKDAGLLSSSLLKFQWKKENRTRLIGDLEEEGKGTAETHKILESSCENLGPAWITMALRQTKDLDLKQRAVKFYGKRSKEKFEVRIANLKKLTQAADCYLQGADARTRVVIAATLAKSEKDLAEEIKNSPMPENLDQASQDQIKLTLNQMADPFEAKSKDFMHLSYEQLEKISDPDEKVALKAKLDLSEDLPLLPVAKAPVPTNSISTSSIASALQDLHKNPNTESSLETLKSYYADHGQGRLAAYYQGRLSQLDQTKPQESAK
jgi:sugar diacid utilization regulator